MLDHGGPSKVTRRFHNEVFATQVEVTVGYTLSSLRARRFVGSWNNTDSPACAGKAAIGSCKSTWKPGQLPFRLPSRSPLTRGLRSIVRQPEFEKSLFETEN